MPTPPPVVTSLSDLFSGTGPPNPLLWKISNPTVDANARQRGALYDDDMPHYDVTQGGGALLLGDFASDTVKQDVGAAIKSKWWLSGDFQFDAELANLGSLRPDGTRRYYIGLIVRMLLEKEYMIRVFDLGAANYRARGGFNNYSAWTETPDSTNLVANGMVIRIARTAGVVSMVLDPAGVAENLKPAALIDYPDPVQIILFGCCELGNHWATVDPTPGFASIDVSGAASLVVYDGAVDHFFAWDHVTDLGGGINDGIELFVDTEP